MLQNSRQKNTQVRANSGLLLKEHNAEINYASSLGRVGQEKNAETKGETEYEKLNIKVKQQHSNFYFSKYKVNTIVHTKTVCSWKIWIWKGSRIRSTCVVTYFYEDIHWAVWINSWGPSFGNMSDIKDKYAVLPRKTLQMLEDRYDETDVNKKAEQPVVKTDCCYQKGCWQVEKSNWVAWYR